MTKYREMNTQCDQTANHQELIRIFEADAEPEAPFHHADHVRLAYAYLCEYPLFVAVEKFSAALKRYAAARGKSELYNATITAAYFFLIHERLARSEAADWGSFIEANTDLLVWKKGILDEYYEEATLKSELARKIFLMPDKCRNRDNAG